MSDRDWDSPEYKAYRAAVRKRDGYKCVRCGSRRRLQVHHVKRFADEDGLRFDPRNGATLCKKCHGLVTGNEAEFEPAVQQRPKDKFSVDLMLKVMMQRYE